MSLEANRDLRPDFLAKIRPELEDVRYSECLHCGGILAGSDRRTGLHSLQQPGIVWPPDPQNPKSPLPGKPRLCSTAYSVECSH